MSMAIEYGLWYYPDLRTMGFSPSNSFELSRQTEFPEFQGCVGMTQAQVAPWQAVLQKSAPVLFKDFTAVRESIMQDGALSLKVKTLMTMVCDALLAHPEGVATIANRARGMGASEEEIAEAVAVAFYMGGTPALVTGANAFQD